jgi:hypothetical protein
MASSPFCLRVRRVPQALYESPEISSYELFSLRPNAFPGFQELFNAGNVFVWKVLARVDQP